MIALAGQLIGLGVVAPLYSFLSLLPAPPSSEESLPSHHSNLAPTISTPLLTRDPSPSSSASSSPSRGGGRRTLNPFHLLPTTTPSSSRKSPEPTPSTTLLPALVLAYYLPAALMLFHPVSADRQAWLFVWQLFPVYLAVASFVLSRIPLRLPGKRAERTAMQKLDAEVRGARVCIGALVALAVGVWWGTWVRSESMRGMVALFVPRGMPAGELPSLEGFAAEFLRWDEMFVFAGVLGWLGYLLAELGVVTGVLGRMGVVVGGMASVVVVGPGATAGLGWLWREEVMFKRREKEVLLREVEAKVEELLRANGA